MAMQKKIQSKTKVKTKTKSKVMTKVKAKVKTKVKTETLTQDSLLGKKLKSLQLPMTGNKTFNVSDWKGKRVVLYFYPKDMTPGCTIEGHEFTNLKKEFKKLNTEVFGISRDSVSLHEKFIQKENYTIDLLSDEKETACKLFDVIKEKNMYGKKVMGIERSTFLVDVNGAVEKVWRKVKAEGHAQEVLDYIKGT